MKVFLKWFAIPLLIAVIASVLYLFDALVGSLLVSGGSFMWVAFAIWTIFYGAKLKDRIKGFIGVVVGFGAACAMMAITGSFSMNVHTISISCLVGVFVVNFLVMFMDKGDKIWLSSVSGAFAGIFLSFSGLGIGMNPLASVGEGFLMLGILALYTLLGLVCGFLSIFYSGKIKKKLAQIEGKDAAESNAENSEAGEEKKEEKTSETEEK